MKNRNLNLNCFNCKNDFLGRKMQKFCSRFCWVKSIKGKLPKNFYEMLRIKRTTPISEETRKKISESHIGKTGGRLGFKITEETRHKLRISHLGQKAWNKGIIMPNMQRENHPRWKGGSSKTERLRLASTSNWKEWRESIFKRDGYRCIDCGNNGYIEPHHIIPLKQTLSRAFDKNNGITLCRPCHLKTLGKEMELASTYSLLIPYSV